MVSNESSVSLAAALVLAPGLLGAGEGVGVGVGVGVGGVTTPSSMTSEV